MASGDSLDATPSAVTRARGGDLFATPLVCEEDLQRITQLWDSSGAGVRTALLAGFLCRFGTRPAADLERGLVGGASLLLARLVASLRLNGTHLSGFGIAASSLSLSPLLAALRVFLGAQQCHRFAAEAVEAGALDALLAILRRHKLRSTTADATLKTLDLLLNSGRRFKKAFVEANGTKVLCEVLGQPKVATPAVAERLEKILLKLNEGNPGHEDELASFMIQLTESTETQAQLVSCRILEAVLPRTSLNTHRQVIAPLLRLLRHPDVELHVQVAGALRQVGKADALNDLVRGVVALLFPTDAINTRHPLYVTEPALSELYAVPASHVFCQQAAAVRVIDLLIASCPRTLNSLLAGNLISGLLVALASTPHPESQLAAARLLRRLAARHSNVQSRIGGALSAAQMALLRCDAERLAQTLSVEDAAKLRDAAGFSYPWEGDEREQTNVGEAASVEEEKSSSLLLAIDEASSSVEEEKSPSLLTLSNVSDLTVSIQLDSSGNLMEQTTGADAEDDGQDEQAWLTLPK